MMKIIIKSKKIKESKEKKLKKEDMGISLLALGIAMLLSSVLAKFWPNIEQLFEGFGKKLDNGLKGAKDGIKFAPIPDEQKNKYLNDFEAAEEDFKQTLKKLKETPEDVSRKLRPSVILMKKAKVILDIVKEIKENHAEELQKKPEVLEKLDSAEKNIGEVWKDIGSLDFISAISSQEDPDGLWNNLASKSPEFKTKFNTKEKWLEFTRLVSGTVDIKNQKGFKTNSLEPVSK